MARLLRMWGGELREMHARLLPQTLTAAHSALTARKGVWSAQIPRSASQKANTERREIGQISIFERWK